MSTVALTIFLIKITGVGAEEIVRRAMKIAGDLCVYTNHNVLVEVIDPGKS
jgi:ATP-dependent HslUV protease subunit HslV